MVAVRPTSLPMLLGWAAIAGVVGWLLVDWTDRMGRLISIPWLAPATIWLFAFTLGLWARSTRSRLSADAGERRMDPIVAARTAALALAASRTGAVVTGAYGGIALGLLGELGIAAGRERMAAAVLACLGGVVLAAVGLWLERICRIPDDGQGGPKGAST